MSTILHMASSTSQVLADEPDDSLEALAASLHGELKTNSTICETCLEFWRHKDLAMRHDGVTESEWDHELSQRAVAHHATAKSLLHSALDGCHLCSLLWRSSRFSGLKTDDQLERYQYRLVGSIDISRCHLHLLESPRGFGGFLESAEVSEETGGVNVNWRKKTHYKPEDRELHGLSSGSLEAFDALRAALQECRDKHPECKTSRPRRPFRPRRLLEVSGRGDDLTIRLDCDDAGSSFRGEYITLSHCWGKHRPLLLLGSLLSDFTRGIPYQHLPKTFQHAVQVVVQTDHRYLWIDSLCIVQDDLDDWRRESVRMRDIYLNSAFNIAALAAGDSTGGLFARRSPLSFQSLKFECGSSAFVIDPANTRESWTSWKSKTAANNALSKRAWALQEYLLPSTNVIYADNSFHVVCPYYETGEFYQSSRLETIGRLDIGAFFALGRTPDQQPREEVTRLRTIISDAIMDESTLGFVWAGVVADFTSRELSEPKDKWMAVAGIAAELRSRYGFRIFAGLPSRHLAETLAWVSTSSVALPRLNNRAPSWSWISFDGRVSFDRLLRRPSHYFKTTLAVFPVQADGDDGQLDWGASKASEQGAFNADLGVLRISAIACPLNCQRGCAQGGNGRPIGTFQRQFCRLQLDNYTPFMLSPDSGEEFDEAWGLIHSVWAEIYGSDRRLCLDADRATELMFGMRIIVVTRTASADAESNPTFRRLGTMTMAFNLKPDAGVDGMSASQAVEEIASKDLYELGDRVDALFI